MITNFAQIAFATGILAMGLLLAPAPANANGITVSPLSDTLTVYDRSGAQVYKISATEGSETGSSEGDDSGNLFFINHPGLVNSDMLDPRIFLCDPNGKISDVFGIFKLDDSGSEDKTGESSKWSLWKGSQGTDGNDSEGSDDSKKQAVLGFLSDPIHFDSLDFDSKQCGKTITCIPEGRGGSPGNATLFLSKDLRKLGYTATFMSDSEVPEPATTGLFFGIGALGLCIWKRRTTA